MRKRSRGGFFSDWRRVVAVIVAAALLLGAAVFLILRLNKPGETEEAAPNPVATITMADGSQMRFELRPDQAPNTVANFISLANSGFYNKSADESGRQEFFRVVAGVLIQGGDPENNGTGGPKYAIKGEFSENGVENSLSHMRGTISMARQSGYDTAGSQFFIMQGSYPEYDGRYAAFGTIADEESLATLDAIASQPTDSNYLPLTRQAIASIRVETFDVDYGDPEKVDRE